MSVYVQEYRLYSKDQIEIAAGRRVGDTSGHVQNTNRRKFQLTSHILRYRSVLLRATVDENDKIGFLLRITTLSLFFFRICRNQNLEIILIHVF